MTLTLPEQKRLLTGRKVKRAFGASVSVAIKSQICDAVTGEVIKDNPFKNNLVMDQGLNAMARSTTGTLRCGPASVARVCRIGDSTTATKFASGAITFTQALFTVTASAPFFTAGMVGGIFKYGTGTGGAEYYITGFTSTTVVTVDTSTTVAAPTVATVWQVQQTTMGNLLYTSSTYQTAGGDNATTIVGNIVTHQRTFIFSPQAAPYNVNEIGYNSLSSGVLICGRIVLSSTDVVGVTNFYRVVIQVAVTYTPSAPTAVANIGTGFNTAGNAMIEGFDIGTVTSAGAVGTLGMSALDANSDYSGGPGLFVGLYLIARIASTYTQNAAIASGGPNVSWGTVNTNYLLVDNSLPNWQYTGTRGKMRVSFTGNITTSGQTCYAIGFSGNYNFTAANQNLPAFDVLFTTPQALPSGAWLPSIQFELTYGRTLNN